MGETIVSIQQRKSLTKGNFTEWEKISANHISDKGLKLLQLNSRK